MEVYAQILGVYAQTVIYMYRCIHVACEIHGYRYVSLSPVEGCWLDSLHFDHLHFAGFLCRRLRIPGFCKIWGFGVLGFRVSLRF